MKNDNLYYIAEEVAYSAKGHFKTSDWIKISLSVYIFVPMVTSLLLLFFNFEDFVSRFLSFLGLLFSMIALSSSMASNRDKANNRVKKHMELGNEYLEVFKKLRQMHSDEGGIDLAQITARVGEIDKKTNNYKISFIGRWWAKIKINKEMDLSWIRNKQ